MNTHRFLHETLELSGPFLLALAILAIASVAAGLVLSRVRRFAAGGRHLILSMALLVPVVTAALSASRAAAGLRSWMAGVPAPLAIEVSSGEPGIAAAAVSAPVSGERACILTLIWLAGAAAFLLRTGAHWLRWRRVARQATTVVDAALLERFGAAAIGRAPKLAVSPEAAEPMVIGLLRPVVVLPDRYAERFSAGEIVAVFAHELEHVRRRDNVSAVVHEIVCALFWFDPLHWIARRRLLHLRERACDERVLERGCSVDEYLSALARTSHAAIESPAIACMSGFHIRERMDSIMGYASQRTGLVSEKWIRTTAFALSLMVVAGFAFLSPLPSIAAPAEPVRSFDVQLRRGADGRVLVEVSIAGPDGETVMNARSVVAAGRPVRLSSASGSITYQVEVSLNADGGGVATLEVLDASNVVYRSSRPLMAHADAVVGETQPITLKLKDADLHDVLRTFSELSGMRIDADPSLQGKITVEMTDVPWYLALRQLLAPLGLTAQRDGDGLRVVRATASVAGPDGYLRVRDGIRPPQVLARVEPIFTAEARAARVSGIVILETRVDETGVVRDVKIVKNMPFGLGDAAADAVRQWVFAPAMRDGRPVAVVYNLTVNFRSDGAVAVAPPR